MSRELAGARAEFAARPSAILVHDPVPLGALEVMDGAVNAGTFEVTRRRRGRH